MNLLGKPRLKVSSLGYIFNKHKHTDIDTQSHTDTLDWEPFSNFYLQGNSRSNAEAGKIESELQILCFPNMYIGFVCV